MYIKTTFFRVNFCINVTDAETGEVYLSSGDFDCAYDCTVDEAFQEVFAGLTCRWEHDRDLHPYVLRRCKDAINSMYEQQVYDLDIYMKAEDNLIKLCAIKLCANVTIHAEI